MTRLQKTALLAFLLLLVVAAIGAYLGGKKARPADAEPRTVILDPAHLNSVRLLPPERRQVLQPERFTAPPVHHPLQPGGGRVAGADLDNPPPLPEVDPVVRPAEAGYREIRVRQGEILSRIAKRELGDASRWTEILQLNGLKSDREVRAGQKLLLPPMDGGSGFSTNQAPSLAHEPAAAQEYTVQSGDVLGRIALRFYGDASLIEPILQANGMRDAKALRAGQVLTIPPR